MKYEQFLPPTYLKSFVQYFWTLESQDNNPLPQAFGPLADGCPGIFFQERKNGIFYDEENKQLPQLFLYGQTIKRTRIYLIGKFKTVGVSFFPNVLKSVFGFDASELTDECLDLNLLSTFLSEQLTETPLPIDQIDILSAFLYSKIKQTDVKRDEITHYAYHQIIESGGLLALRDLQKDLQLSERSFERRFNQYIGISPKLFSKVCRFQASLRQLKSNRYSKLSDIAYDNGYADQSHFIRAFKEFSGFSPYQFQKQYFELAENFPLLLK
ncbi:DUF6597 domain-containing transcriptional factor [Flavitalea flava]